MFIMQKFKYLQILSLTGFILSLIFGSCTTNKTPEQMAVSKTKTYLALGDSYTIGESVNYTDRFSVQLSSKLTKQQVKLNPPQIIAATGWTTASLLEALEIKKPGTDYDLVTLLIGVNNQYQGKSLDNYKIEFSQLLDLSIKYAGGNKGKVVVLSIPDYSVTPFAANSDTAAIAHQIDLFNVANKTITTNAGVAYVDITDISRIKNPALIATDGLHPSAYQYSLWVEKLLPVVANILQ